MKTVLDRLKNSPKRPEYLFNIRELADALGIAISTIRESRKRGTFPIEPVATDTNGALLFHVADIQDALLENAFPKPRKTTQLTNDI